MGLIKAAFGSAGGVLADQWKEFFYCESMPKEILVTKGQKRVSGRSSNTKGNDNIISNGSGIAVADGQCMIIVEQGKIVEVCAEPGEFTYDTSTEPSIFSGSLGDSIKQTFKTIGKRFTYGGELRPNQIVTHNTDLENAMNTALSEKWGELRGLKVVSIALGSVTLPDEDAEMIKQAQRTAIMRDPTMAAATLVGAQADAMKAAASNEAGAMTGFMGMGMAMNAGGGMNAQNLFAMVQQQQQAQQAPATPAVYGYRLNCCRNYRYNFKSYRQQGI